MTRLDAYDEYRESVEKDSPKQRKDFYAGWDAAYSNIPNILLEIEDLRAENEKLDAMSKLCDRCGQIVENEYLSEKQ